MSISGRISGILLALTYGLERAKIGFLRLRVAALWLCCLCAAYAAYTGWQRGFGLAHGAAIALCFAVLAVLVWADRHHYVIFHGQPAPPAAETPGLSAEEKLQLRGSGVFQVSDMSRYLVEVPVVFWTTGLAEHIVAAKVRALNALGIGVPSQERGWWYIFLEPKHIAEITAGQLCFGLSLRPSVCVRYEAQKGQEVVYLSCDSPEQRARLLKELATRAEAARQGARKARARVRS